jgi:hypothetical protein
VGVSPPARKAFTPASCAAAISSAVIVAEWSSLAVPGGVVPVPPVSISVPFMPSESWPGTVHRTSYVPSSSAGTWRTAFEPGPIEAVSNVCPAATTPNVCAAAPSFRTANVSGAPAGPSRCEGSIAKSESVTSIETPAARSPSPPVSGKRSAPPPHAAVTRTRRVPSTSVVRHA